jgi:predicted nucleic acid-binding protein
MVNVFLDTNIIIDFLDINRENHLRAVELLKLLNERNSEIYISEDMLSTVYYLIKDKSKVLLFLREIMKLWNVVTFEKDVINSAIEESLSKNVDFEDALQCFCAKKHRCIIIANDKKFVNCGIEIMDYDDFFKSLR